MKWPPNCPWNILLTFRSSESPTFIPTWCSVQSPFSYELQTTVPPTHPWSSPTSSAPCPYEQRPRPIPELHQSARRHRLLATCRRGKASETNGLWTGTGTGDRWPGMKNHSPADVDCGNHWLHLCYLQLLAWLWNWLYNDPASKKCHIAS